MARSFRKTIGVVAAGRKVNGFKSQESQGGGKGKEADALFF